MPEMEPLGGLVGNMDYIWAMLSQTLSIILNDNLSDEVDRPPILT